MAYAGPYNEIGVNGYIGNDWCHADPCDADAVLNPIFRGWASGVAQYQPAAGVGIDWIDPAKALGPAIGNHTDIVSLGDNFPAGYITITFGDPEVPGHPDHIRNEPGYDFVIFENAFAATWNDPVLGFFQGQVFVELAYVEVSSNGTDFARFAPVSLIEGPVQRYGTIDSNNVYNFAGKHPNGYGLCTGTGFDLEQLKHLSVVEDSTVDINDITHIRMVDIPGTGDFADIAVEHIDPATGGAWQYYLNNHPIYDPWQTLDSGGLDLEAIGVLHAQQHKGDINMDGSADIFDLAAFATSWQNSFGDTGYIARCDMAEPINLKVNFSDFAIFANSWKEKELWRTP